MKKGKFLYSILTIALIIFITGCDSKEEKVEDQYSNEETPAVVDSAVNNAMVDSSEKLDSTVSDGKNTPVISGNDITGKWTGKFDQRATTLNITEQNGNEFKGKITINYREQINQEVSGTIDPETKEVKMKDMLHSRYAGTYEGKLSEDLKSLSGTFTMNAENKKFEFNLTKK